MDQLLPPAGAIMALVDAETDPKEEEEEGGGSAEEEEAKEEGALADDEPEPRRRRKRILRVPRWTSNVDAASSSGTGPAADAGDAGGGGGSEGHSIRRRISMRRSGALSRGRKKASAEQSPHAVDAGASSAASADELSVDEGPNPALVELALATPEALLELRQQGYAAQAAQGYAARHLGEPPEAAAREKAAERSEGGAAHHSRVPSSVPSACESTLTHESSA